jgi:hypothetical protein
MRSDISVLGSVSFAWLHEHGRLRFDELFFMDPRCRLDRERAANALVAERFPDEPIYNFEGSLVQVEGRRRPVALVGGIQPNLILGAAVGAKLVFYGDKDADITQTPLAGISDLGPLWRIDWEHTWPIDLFLRQIRGTREWAGPEYVIVPPFFWDTTGRATVHGVLTTAQKLLGERVFIDIADNPDFIRELFDWIADAYARLIRLFADAAGMEITGLHVGECSACMLGPEPFAEFVLPATNRLAASVLKPHQVARARDPAKPAEVSRRVYPGAAEHLPVGGGVRLHSCGLSDQLLDVLAGLSDLTCLNVGSNTSIATIRERFADIRIDVIPDTHLLTSATPGDVDAWVRRSVGENGGGAMEFQFHLDAGQPEANCVQIARTLRALGHPCGREPVF